MFTAAPATISLVLDVIKRPDLQIYWHSLRLLKAGLAFAMFDFSNETRTENPSHRRRLYRVFTRIEQDK